MKHIVLLVILASAAHAQIFGSANARRIMNTAIDAATCAAPTDGKVLIYDNAMTKYKCGDPTAVWAGSMANWPYSFTSQTSLNITTHPFTTKNLVVAVYDLSGNLIIPYSLSVNPSTYAVVIDFNGVSTSGLVIISGVSTVGPVALGGTLSGATAGRLLYVGSGPVIAETSAWNLSGSTLTGSGHLLFSADNTYDIGASGATRPRNIYLAGNIVAGGYVAGGIYPSYSILNAASYYRWDGRSVMYSPSDGAIYLTNNAGTDFNRLQFGGTTSAFPAIKRNGAGIEARLADDSGPTTIIAAPGGTVGAWAKYTVASSDTIFNAAATSVTKTIVALPAMAVVEGIRIKTSDAFAGTGITACTVSLGDGTTADKYTPAFDLVAAVSATNQWWDGGAYSATDASHNLVATVVCNTNVGSGSATVLTAGNVDVWVKYAVLP